VPYAMRPLVSTLRPVAWSPWHGRALRSVAISECGGTLLAFHALLQRWLPLSKQDDVRIVQVRSIPNGGAPPRF
jgi:hypothetical protein